MIQHDALCVPLLVRNVAKFWLEEPWTNWLVRLVRSIPTQGWLLQYCGVVNGTCYTWRIITFLAFAARDGAGTRVVHLDKTGFPTI